MWVKICANTELEDALEAVRLGADAVGFVFAPSVRQVNASQVRAITERLPADVERVGVFAAAEPETIAAAVQAAGLTAVQLHGGLDLKLAGRLQLLMGTEIEIIHTVHWEVNSGAETEAQVRALLAALAAAVPGARVLVDAKVGAASGGLGVRFDWDRARLVFDEARAAGLRVIVAGGLRPENVAEAIAVLQPYGVDVASGVERSPGRKDAEKLTAFVENARQAELCRAPGNPDSNTLDRSAFVPMLRMDGAPER